MSSRSSRRRRRATIPPLYIGIAAAAVVILLLIIYFTTHNKLVITLNGGTETVVGYQTDYTDPGATAAITNRTFGREDEPVEVTASGSVDTETMGRYTITYTATSGHTTATATRTVTVTDVTAPEISLYIQPNSYTAPGAEYQEEGYRATDNMDGDLTDQVKVSYTEDTATYTVTDSCGNSTTRVRTINHVDPDAPVLTLVDADEVYSTICGQPYVDPGYTATDVEDGDLTDKVVISDLNTDKAGVYEVTYTVSDSYGNTTTAQRKVNVYVPNDPSSKVIYLTFDDGPGPYTEELLDILKKFNVKATFFVTNQYPKYQDLIKREAEEGHTVAIHTLTHDYETIYSSVQAFIDDITAMNDIIEEQTGSRTDILRFPGGSSNTVSAKYCVGVMSDLALELTKEGYIYVDWNVVSGDAGDTTSTEKVYENVTNGIAEREGSSIILQHDVKEFSVDAVARIIVWGKSHGYTFAALDENSPTSHQTINN